MPVEKYLKLDSSTGRKKVMTPVVTSSGASDGGKIAALDETTGRFDSSLMPAGFGAEVKTMPASENLAAGDFVNIFDDSGTLKCRKADGSAAAKRADGFVLAAHTAGATATVYYGNLNNQLTGLTRGARYFLSSSSPGTVTTTPPTTSGHIVQYLGKATGTTEMIVEIAEEVEL